MKYLIPMKAGDLKLGDLIYLTEFNHVGRVTHKSQNIISVAYVDDDVFYEGHVYENEDVHRIIEFIDVDVEAAESLAIRS